MLWLCWSCLFKVSNEVSEALVMAVFLLSIQGSLWLYELSCALVYWQFQVNSEALWLYRLFCSCLLKVSREVLRLCLWLYRFCSVLVYWNFQVKCPRLSWLYKLEFLENIKWALSLSFLRYKLYPAVVCSMFCVNSMRLFSWQHVFDHLFVYSLV